MEVAYLINVAFWIIVFGLVGAILQLTLRAFGVTLGLGGIMFIVLSVLQDGFGGGPTFLYYVPFNVTSGIVLNVPPWITSAVLFVASVTSMFFVERTVNKAAV